MACSQHSQTHQEHAEIKFCERQDSTVMLYFCSKNMPLVDKVAAFFNDPKNAIDCKISIVDAYGLSILEANFSYFLTESNQTLLKMRIGDILAQHGFHLVAISATIGGGDAGGMANLHWRGLSIEKWSRNLHSQEDTV